MFIPANSMGMTASSNNQHRNLSYFSKDCWWALSNAVIHTSKVESTSIVAIFEIEAVHLVHLVSLGIEERLLNGDLTWFDNGAICGSLDKNHTFGNWFKPNNVFLVPRRQQELHYYNVDLKQSGFRKIHISQGATRWRRWMMVGAAVFGGSAGETR